MTDVIKDCIIDPRRREYHKIINEVKVSFFFSMFDSELVLFVSV